MLQEILMKITKKNNQFKINHVFTYAIMKIIEPNKKDVNTEEEERASREYIDKMLAQEMQE